MLQSWYQKTAQPLVNMLLFCDTIGYHDMLKILSTALGAFNLKTAQWNLFMLSTFGKHNNMQFLANFKKGL